MSDDTRPLRIEHRTIADLAELYARAHQCTDVCVVRLPPSPDGISGVENVGEIVAKVARAIARGSTLVTIGEVPDLVRVQSALPGEARYQLWIAIKRTHPVDRGSWALPSHHFGALVHTKYPSALRHVKTRIGYSYCPSCHRTTKDYGGKKHTYHEFGTLISDVWRDASFDPGGDLGALYSRFADLFGMEPYTTLEVFDVSSLGLPRTPPAPRHGRREFETNVDDGLAGIENRIVLGDCLRELQKIPDNSVDFVFADPPYNVGKSYEGYSDDRSFAEYSSWCDRWIDELFRILKPGRTCAVVNIPLLATRHFRHMEQSYDYQNWIVWDALSFPVRRVMPAHYAIVCFSKGSPRPLPGRSEADAAVPAQDPFLSLQPVGELFCLRPSCVKQRRRADVDDRGSLTDLWWGIHRLKHNARRVDHPCQLPPRLLYRMLALFTRPGEIVLDCFNGAGTTTLAAHQMGRRYIGIESSADYCVLAAARHGEVSAGIDPFRTAARELKAKNSPVARRPKQRYEVSKKELQLEIKRIAAVLGRVPSRKDVLERSRYPIGFYDRYFSSWGEACAAARTTGMTDRRQEEISGTDGI